MRATFNIGLICATVAFVSFLKYFAGPMALQRVQQEFVLNMMMLGGDKMMLRRPNRPNSNQKITYYLETRKPGVPGLWGAEGVMDLPPGFEHEHEE